MNQSGQVPLHGVTMESMDPRVKPEDDSFPELSCPDLIGASRCIVDPRVKPEDDSFPELSCSDLIGASSLIFVIPGLTGNPGVHA